MNIPGVGDRIRQSAECYCTKSSRTARRFGEEYKIIESGNILDLGGCGVYRDRGSIEVTLKNRVDHLGTTWRLRRDERERDGDVDVDHGNELLE